MGKTVLSTRGKSILDELQNRYSSLALQPILPLLTCPVEHAITTCLAHRDLQEVLTSSEASMFDEIARYVDV